MTLVLLLVYAGLNLPGQQRGTPDNPPEEPKLPDGRSQREEILKADHEKSLKDASELIRLCEELKADLEKNDRHVLSVGTLRRLDEIEKLAKRVRGRMKRY